MRRRRAVVVFILSTIGLILLGGAFPSMIRESLPVHEQQWNQNAPNEQVAGLSDALEGLNRLEIKGRAPKTGYERSQFGDGWAKVNGCTTREIILYRDLTNTVLDGACKIISGTLLDPYTGEKIEFSKERSSEVQIDHVIALSDAWQKGAQLLSDERRVQLANDPLELIAVSGAENQAKSDGDAATWLPKNKSFRCEYIARQIAVKLKYSLWVTQAEYDAMKSVLNNCPGQTLVQ